MREDLPQNRSKEGTHEPRVRQAKPGQGGGDRSVSETLRWNLAGNQSRPVEEATSRKRVLRETGSNAGCEA
jgi:hypothetical protein